MAATLADAAPPGAALPGAALPGATLPGAALACAALACAVAGCDAGGPLRVEAECRLLDAVALEPLGEADGESVWRASARCLARLGPLPGATADAEWIWELDRGRLDAGVLHWVDASGHFSITVGQTAVRRESDGRWRTDSQGVVESAGGRAAAHRGRPYVLVARLEDPQAPVWAMAP
jgi:hypothetical protein